MNDHEKALHLLLSLNFNKDKYLRILTKMITNGYYTDEDVEMLEVHSNLIVEIEDHIMVILERIQLDGYFNF